MSKWTKWNDMINTTDSRAFILHTSMNIHWGRVLVYVWSLNCTNYDSTFIKATHLSPSLYQFWIWWSCCQTFCKWWKVPAWQCLRLWVLSVAAGDVGLWEGPERQPPGAASGQRPARSDAQSGDCLGTIPSELRETKRSKRKGSGWIFWALPAVFSPPVVFSSVFLDDQLHKQGK